MLNSLPLAVVMSETVNQFKNRLHIFQSNQDLIFDSTSASRQSAVLAMIDSVPPTVRHSPVSCQNNSSYDHAVFTGG